LYIAEGATHASRKRRGKKADCGSRFHSLISRKKGGKKKKRRKGRAAWSRALRPYDVHLLRKKKGGGEDGR